MNKSPLLLLLLLLAACAEVAEAPPTPRAKAPKVLVVGWDGARPDAVTAARTPTFDALAAAGAYSLAASTQLEADTVSSPGWMSLLTGVDADKHGVLDNSELFEQELAYPSFLKRARDAGLRTAAACDWEALCGLAFFREGAVDESVTGDERRVTDALLKWLADDAADVYFIHIDLPDHAGHASGYSAENPEYIESIEQSDALTGELVAAVEARSSRADERWLIALVTDHGGEGTGHGPRNEANRRIYLVLSGDGVAPGEFDRRAYQMDLHPTVMTYLGIPPLGDWDLDGTAIGLAAD